MLNVALKEQPFYFIFADIIKMIILYAHVFLLMYCNVISKSFVWRVLSFFFILNWYLKNILSQADLFYQLL